MRRLYVLLAAVLFVSALAPAVSAAQVQIDGINSESEYLFEPDDSEGIYLEDVRLDPIDIGGGYYQAVLTFTPTQDIMDAILSSGWSHVDFRFTFHGLERSEEWSGLVPGVSDYVRQVGAVVEDEPSEVVYTAMGLNLDPRWIAGEPIVVLAPIFGYEPASSRIRVSVELVVAKYWPADGSCEVVYVWNFNQKDYSYCTEKGARSTLVDFDGRTRFPLRKAY